MIEGAEPTLLPSKRDFRVHTGPSSLIARHSAPSVPVPGFRAASGKPVGTVRRRSPWPPHCGCSPAGVHWEVLRVIGVLFIFLEVQLSQQLAGFGHTVVHSPVLQDALRSPNLPWKSSVTMQARSLQVSST